MDASAPHVLIAANPKSGAVSSRQRVGELREALIARGFACQLLHDLQAVQRESLALQAAGRLRAVVSAGGDGTADALANLLPSQVPMLVFPLGTENLLAKYLQITGDIRQACEIVQVDQRMLLDVGHANGKLFLVMLSCGFDAEVVRHMHAIRTGHINRWSYTRPIWSSLRKYRFPQLRFEIDGDPTGPAASLAVTPVAADVGEAVAAENAAEQPLLAPAPVPATVGCQPPTSAAWLFVFNVPRYAAALDFCPQADPCDGLLDVCLFQRSGIASGLNYLTRLWLGSHQRAPGFYHVRCRRLRIEAPTDRLGQPLDDVPYQIDGDPGGVLPLEVEVGAGRLSLLIPPK